MLKECGTNTEVDFDRELTERESAMIKKETEFAKKEQAFVSRELAQLETQSKLEAKVRDLEEQLEATMTKSQQTDVSNVKLALQLEEKEKEQAETIKQLDARIAGLTQSLAIAEHDLSAKIGDLNSQHLQQIVVLEAAKNSSETKLSDMNSKVASLNEALVSKEQQLTDKDAQCAKYERTIAALSAEVDQWRTDSSVRSSKMTDELQSRKQQVEEVQGRNKQLEKQLADLQSTMEAVYNKCIEKDESIHQLKRNLMAKQNEAEELKAQHSKAMDRQDKLAQQQQVLYDKQLQTSVLQVEMEFRKEHQQTTQQYQDLQRRYQEVVKEIHRLKELYSVSRKREASARTEILKIQAILADDKQKLYAEDTKRADSYEQKLRVAQDRCAELENQLAELSRQNQRVVELEKQIDDQHTSKSEMRTEIEQFQTQREAWSKQEDDLRAAIKVKDIMLQDQQRQIDELRHDRDDLECRFNDEMAECQSQIEELEVALDDNLRKLQDKKIKTEAFQAENEALKKQVDDLNSQLDAVERELAQKAAAFEFIEQEMEKMRTSLFNQDAIAQKRIQTRLEQHREELERVRAATEEEQERRRMEWEVERGEMMRKYQSLSSELQNVVSQNGKLRIAVDVECKKNAQNDHDMRVLLAQVIRFEIEGVCHRLT